MIGRVVATKMQKTVTILEEGEKKHPLYKKSFKRSKKYLVHDPIGVAMGDMVEVVKIAPVSKRKHFKIVKVLGKQLAEITEEKLKEHARGVIEEVMPEEKEKKQKIEKENTTKKEEGGKQTKVIADDLAQQAKSKSDKGTKSVRNK